MDRNIEAIEKAVLDRICAVCVDRRDDGTCGLDAGLECAIKVHLPEILEAVRGVSSDTIEAYVERIRRSVCAVCEQGNRDDTCDVRARVDCPLDRYLLLVVEAIADLESGRSGEAMASAP